MNKSTNPISVRALCENFLVFLGYGFFIAVIINVMSVFQIDLVKIQAIMMEPFSIYAFSLLSMIGLIGLGLVNLTYARTAHAMFQSMLVRKILVPISNAGLSAGAIIAGMLTGIAIGLCVSLTFYTVDLRLIKLVLAMAFYVVALIVPLTLMKRSMFDETMDEERLSTIVGILYAVVIFAVFYMLDREKFFMFLGILIVLGIVVTLAMGYFRKSAMRNRLKM